MRKIHFFLLFVLMAACSSCREKLPTSGLPQPAAMEAVPAEKFSDIQVPDLDRNAFSLMEEIGRNDVTVIDFWASWCGPCRQEAPNLINIYHSYKEKGLGIIGISLDEEYDDWKAAVSQLGFAWPQVSELRGWDDAVARQYGVSAIPHTIVVARDGTILARGLRGAELDAFIAKQFEK